MHIPSFLVHHTNFQTSSQTIFRYFIINIIRDSSLSYSCVISGSKIGHRCNVNFQYNEINISMLDNLNQWWRLRSQDIHHLLAFFTVYLLLNNKSLRANSLEDFFVYNYLRKNSAIYLEFKGFYSFFQIFCEGIVFNIVKQYWEKVAICKSKFEV